MAMDDLATSVRRATSADVAAITQLVNRAYAVEAEFVDGDRTSDGEVADLIGRGTFLVLEHKAGLAAAVHVEPDGGFGMLAVDPMHQHHGLGTRLVRVAEAMSEAAGCTSVHIRIVNLREQLARWYRSLGYRFVGTAPFEHRARKRPCHFDVLEKPLVRTPALVT